MSFETSMNEVRAQLKKLSARVNDFDFIQELQRKHPNAVASLMVIDVTPPVKEVKERKEKKEKPRGTVYNDFDVFLSEIILVPINEYQARVNKNQDKLQLGEISKIPPWEFEKLAVKKLSEIGSAADISINGAKVDIVKDFDQLGKYRLTAEDRTRAAFVANLEEGAILSALDDCLVKTKFVPTWQHLSNHIQLDVSWSAKVRDAYRCVRKYNLLIYSNLNITLLTMWRVKLEAYLNKNPRCARLLTGTDADFSFDAKRYAFSIDNFTVREEATKKLEENSSKDTVGEENFFSDEEMDVRS